jgi:beta-lactamase class A
MDGRRPHRTTRAAPRVLVVLVALTALAGGVAAHVPAASAAPSPQGRLQRARATGPAVSSVAGRSTQSPVADAIATYLRGRSGGTTVAVRDNVGGTSFTVNRSQRHYCASIVKVDILQTLLRQRHGRLTSGQRDLAARMIRKSDNAAASALWRQIGGGKALAAYHRVAGLQHTTPGPGGYWGLTVTSASDQRRLLAIVATHNTVLADSSRRYLTDLMRHVVSSQRWGVSAGVPSAASVALKNGWLPVHRNDRDWQVNSVGFVRGQGRSYDIAVLSRHNPDQRYGIATVEKIAAVVWAHAARS